MSEQTWVELARAGGAAVVRAAGTDAWAGLREALARWFGRGDEQRHRTELELLDRTAAELLGAQEGGAADAAHARADGDRVWRSRIERLLKELPEHERRRAAEELRELLRHHAPHYANESGTGGIAVQESLWIHAEQTSIAAGVVNGNVTASFPPVPDPIQG
ncbi:hypothetical protein HHL19_18270 [Streptomyces sp. R302]|uniref:hypothetical protein n=1 Tax=unclassified Streptomyces TaxID=2593676 RepID=UPI00145CEDED|nr:MULTISPECIES: hypothetical protein [unclassified Streptomyces]NML52503.1 hypothetical protein [Streptomyces sp. R301]NML80568.1 hypothetical protein [Streptomyces sp. R302]